MTTQDIIMFFNTILKLCGALAVLYGGANVIAKMFSPYRKLEETVQHHSDLLNSDNERLKDVEESNKLTLKCMICLIDHQITGNGIDTMKELKKEVNDFLVDK